MGFSIQDYLKNNKIEMGKITKEVGDTPFKGGHNDIRKTNYDVKITEDGKLDLYTHKKVITESKKTLNEASKIEFNELDSTKQKLVKQLEGFFDGKMQTLYDGIHGYIVEIKVGIGGTRLTNGDLKELASMKIRWIEYDDRIVSIGF
jgi:cold shock CspA family protein